MTKLIQSKNDMLDYFEKGAKSSNSLGIGSEWEMFVYNQKDGSNVTFKGENGLENLIKKLGARLSLKEVKEEGNTIGLQGDFGSVSVEPGLQLEFASSVKHNLHEIEQDNTRFAKELKIATKDMGLGVFYSGFHPFLTPNTTDIVPKKRYDIMYNYMPKVGSLGRYMMKNTTTTQANVSYSSEEHMSDILVTFNKIAPVITALFANSAIVEGKVSPYQSFRGHIWQHTDNSRTGLKEFIFKNNKVSFEDYLNFALDVPMYFIIRDGKYIDFTGKSFKDFINKKGKEFENYEPTLNDFITHLSCIFPEVRLKNYLEIRSADSNSLPYVVALSAFVAGIAHNNNSLKEALNLVKDWSYEETQNLLQSVTKQGLNAEIKGKKLSYFSNVLVDIAKSGLNSRNITNNKGFNESEYLSVLELTSEVDNSAFNQIEDFESRPMLAYLALRSL